MCFTGFSLVFFCFDCFFKILPIFPHLSNYLTHTIISVIVNQKKPCQILYSLSLPRVKQNETTIQPAFF